MDDLALVSAYQNGDGDALGALVARHEPLLYRIARRMLRNEADAQDAVQEMLIRLVKALPHYRGDAKFTTWLYRLATNTCIDMQRRQGRMAPTTELPEALPLAAPAEQADPDTQCEKSFRHRLIDEALRQLPEAQRHLLVLRDREGLSNQEVAERLGVEVGTLKARLHRARAALRRVLESGVQVQGLEQHGRYRLDSSGAVL